MDYKHMSEFDHEKEAEPEILLESKEAFHASISELLELRNGNQFEECNWIASEVENVHRKDLMKHWVNLHNQRKKLDFYNETFGCTLSVEMSRVTLDIICLFKVVLPVFKDHIVKLSMIENLEKENNNEEIYEKYWILISEEEPSVIIVDFSDRFESGLNIFCFTNQSKGIGDKKMNMLKKLCLERGCINTIHHVHSIQIELTDVSSNLFVTGVVLNRFLRTTSFSEVITIGLDEIAELEKETIALTSEYRKINAGNHSKKFILLESFKKVIKFFDLATKDFTSCFEHVDEMEEIKAILDIHYDNMMDRIRPKSFSEEAQLHLLLLSNKQHFINISIVSNLKSLCSSGEVTNFISVFQLYEQFQGMISKLYCYLMQGKINCEAYEYACNATQQVAEATNYLLRSIHFDDNGFPSAKLNLQDNVKRIEGLINSFLQQNLFGNQDEIIEFNILDPTVAPDEFESEDPPKEKKAQSFLFHVTQQAINSYVEKLKKLNEKAFQYGFHQFLPKIASTIQEILSWTNIEKDQHDRTIKDVESIRNEIDKACEIVEKEKKIDLNLMRGMKQAPEISQLTIDDLKFEPFAHFLRNEEEVLKEFKSLVGSINIESIWIEDGSYSDELVTFWNNDGLKLILGEVLEPVICILNCSNKEDITKSLKEWFTALQGCINVKAVFKSVAELLSSLLKCYDDQCSTKEFEVLLNKLLKCSTLKNALYLIFTSIDSLSTLCNDDLSFLAENLNKLKSTVDTPECLISISNIELIIKDDLDIEKLETELISLSNTILKERVKALNELEFGSLDRLVEFACIGSSQFPVPLGILSKRLKELYGASQTLNQHIHQCEDRNQSYLLTMDYFNISDFSHFITQSPHIACQVRRRCNDLAASNDFDENKFFNSVCAMFQVDGNFILSEDFVASIAKYSREQIIKVVTKYEEEDDYDSEASVLYSSSNILTLCIKFWSYVGDSLKQLSSLDIKTTKMLIRGEKCKQYFIRVARCKQDLIRITREIQNLEERFKEEEKVNRENVSDFEKSPAKNNEKVFGQYFVENRRSRRVQEQHHKSHLGQLEELKKELTAKQTDLEKIETDYERCIKDEIQRLLLIVAEFGKQLSQQYGAILQCLKNLYSSKISSDNFHLMPEFYDSLRTSLNSDCDEQYKDALKKIAVDIRLLISKALADNEKFWIDLSEILGNSKLYRIFKDFEEIALGTSSSLYRSFEMFTKIVGETEEEKEVKKELQKLKEDALRLVEETIILKESKEGELKEPSQIAKELGDYYHQLINLKSRFPLRGRKINQVQIHHIVNYMSNYIVYFSQDFYEVLPGGILQKFATENFPPAESTTLYEKICREKECLANHPESVSLYAIKEVLESVCIMDKVDRESEKSSILVSLLNASNFLNALKIFAHNVLILCIKSCPSTREAEFTFKLVAVVMELFTIESTKSAENVHALENAFGIAIEEFARTQNEVGNYGGTLLVNEFNNFKKELNKTNSGSTKVFDVVEKMVRDLSRFTVEIILKYQWESCLNSLKFESSNDESLNTANRFEKSDLLLKYFKDGLEQIVYHTCCSFLNPKLYGTAELRFQCIVMPVSDFIQECRRFFTLNHLNSAKDFEANLKICPKLMLSDEQYFTSNLHGHIYKVRSWFGRNSKIKDIEESLTEISNVLECWDLHLSDLEEQRSAMLVRYNKEESMIIEERNAKKQKKYNKDKKEYDSFVNKTKRNIQNLAQEVFRNAFILNTIDKTTIPSGVEETTFSIYKELFLQVRKFEKEFQLDFDTSSLDITSSFEVTLKELWCSSGSYQKLTGNDLKYVVSSNNGNELQSGNINLQGKWYQVERLNKVIDWSFDFNVEFKLMQIPRNEQLFPLRVQLFQENGKIFEGFMNTKCNDCVKNEFRIDDGNLRLKGQYSSYISVQPIVENIDEEFVKSFEDITDEIVVLNWLSKSVSLSKDSIKLLKETIILERPVKPRSESLKEANAVVSKSKDLQLYQVMRKMEALLNGIVTELKKNKEASLVGALNADSLQLADITAISGKFKAIMGVQFCGGKIIDEFLDTFLKAVQKHFKGMKYEKPQDFEVNKEILSLDEVHTKEQNHCVNEIISITTKLSSKLKQTDPRDLYNIICSMMVTLTIIQPPCIKDTLGTLEDIRVDLIPKVPADQSLKCISNIKKKEEELSTTLKETTNWNIDTSNATFDELKFALDSSKYTKIEFSKCLSTTEFIIDLGTFIHGIPMWNSWKPQLVVLSNDDLPCNYEFDVPKYFKLSSINGDLESNEQKIIPIESIYQKLKPKAECYKEEIKLFIRRKDTSTLEQSLILKQNVHEINPLDHIGGVLKCTEEGSTILKLDLGDVTPGKEIQKDLLLSNQLPLPLRLKLHSLHDGLKFENEEVVLKAETAITRQKLTFKSKTKEGEQIIRAVVYFSAKIHYPLHIIYKVVNPIFSIVLKGKLVKGSEPFQNILLTLRPFAETWFKEMHIENKGNVDLKLHLQFKKAEVSKESFVWLQPSQSFSPNICIQTNCDEKTQEDLAVLVSDRNGGLLRKFILHFVITTSWPCIECSPSLFPFHGIDTGKIVERKVTIACKQQPLEIKSLSCIGMKCTNVTLPLTIQPNESIDLIMLVRPQRSLKKGMITMETNCEISTQTFTIGYTNLSLLLKVEPKVLDISRKTNTFVTLSNESYKDIWYGVTCSSQQASLRKKWILCNQLKKNQSDFIEIINKHADADKKHTDVTGLILFKCNTQQMLCVPILSSSIGNNDNVIVRQEVKLNSLDNLITYMKLLLNKSCKLSAGALFPLVFREVSNNTPNIATVIQVSLQKKNFGMIKRCFEKYLSKDFLSSDDFSYIEQGLNLKKDCSNTTQIGKHCSRIANNICDKTGLYALKNMLETTKKATSDYSDINIFEHLCNMFEHYYSPSPMNTLQSVQTCFKKRNPSIHDQILQITQILSIEPFHSPPSISTVGSILSAIVQFHDALTTNKNVVRSNLDQFQCNLIDTIGLFMKYFRKLEEKSEPMEAVRRFNEDKEMIEIEEDFNQCLPFEEDTMEAMNDRINSFFQEYQNTTLSDKYSLIRSLMDIVGLKSEGAEGDFFNELINPSSSPDLNIVKAVALVTNNDTWSRISYLSEQLSIYIVQKRSEDLKTAISFSCSLFPGIIPDELEMIMCLKEHFVNFFKTVNTNKICFLGALETANQIIQTSGGGTSGDDGKDIASLLDFIKKCGEEFIGQRTIYEELASKTEKHFRFNKETMESYQKFIEHYVSEFTKMQSQIRFSLSSKVEGHFDLLIALGKEVGEKITVVHILRYLEDIIEEGKKKTDKDKKKDPFSIAVDIFTLLGDVFASDLAKIARYFASRSDQKVFAQIQLDDLDLQDERLNLIRVKELVNLHINQPKKSGSIAYQISTLLKELTIDESIIRKVVGVTNHIQEFLDKKQNDKTSLANFEKSTLFKTVKKIAQYLPELSQTHLEIVEKFMNGLGLKLEKEKLRWKANKFLIFYSDCPNLRDLAETMKILHDHVKKINLLGYHCIGDLYNTARKIMSGVQEHTPLSLEILKYSETLHLFALRYMDNQRCKSQEMYFVEWLKLSGVELSASASDMIQVVEYVMMTSIIEEQDAMPGFMELVCSLSFVNNSSTKLLRCAANLQISLECKKETIKYLKEISHMEDLVFSFSTAVKGMIALITVGDDLNFTKEICTNIASEVFAAICNDPEKQLKFRISKNYNILKGRFLKESGIDLLFDTMALGNQNCCIFLGLNHDSWRLILRLSDIIEDLVVNKTVTENKILKMSMLMKYLCINLHPSEIIPYEELMLSLVSFVLSKNHVLKVTSSITFCLVTLKFLEINKPVDNSNGISQQMTHADDKDDPQVLQTHDFHIFVDNLPEVVAKRDNEGIQQLVSSQQKLSPSTQKKKKFVPKETLDNHLKQIDNDLANAEELFEKVSSFDVFNKIREEALSIRIDVFTAVSIINYCHQINENMKLVIDRLVFNHHVIQYLTTHLGRIFTILVEIWKAVKMTQHIWNATKINGSFKSTFRKLEDEVKFNMSKVIDYVDDESQQFFRNRLNSAGISLKLRNTVYDYATEKSTEMERMREEVNNYMKDSTNERYGNTDVKISGKMSLAAFDTTSSIPINFGTGSMLQDSEFIISEQEEKKRLIQESNREIQQRKQASMVTKDTKVEERVKNNVTNEKHCRQVERKGYRKTGYRSLTRREQEKITRNRFAENWLKDLNEIEEVSEKVADYQNTEILAAVDEDKLRYALLARLTKQFQSECVRIMTEINRTSDDQKVTHVRQEPAEKQTFKFLFLVDNSGSMDGEKRTLALNILIVLLESLKKMEYETAVVRFGGEESQVTLKDFTDEMNQSRGQYIIEAFDSREKTLVADALKFVSNDPDKLYGIPKRKTEHRFIVLVTDGIWEQTKKSLYDEYLKKAFNPQLLILTTHPSKDKSLHFYNTSVARAKRLLDDIAKDKWWPMDPIEDFGKQIAEVATLIDNNLRKIMENLKAAAQERFSAFKIPQIPKEKLATCDKLENNNMIDIQWGESKFVSDINKLPDFIDPDPKLIENFQKTFDVHLLNASTEEDHLQNKVAVTQRAQVISDEEEKLSQLVNALDSVLDSFAFPNNRPTRYMQDYHGSTFSLKGFIKFLCTDGQYKKIYENMIGHPRKDYTVSIILDVSKSMAGMAAIGSIKAYIALASALHSNNINFSLYTAGSSTNLIKDFNEEWDNNTKSKVYDALTFNDDESNLSDAVLYASQHCSNGASSKVEKTIFIITDGYPSAPKRLRMSLSYADSLGIQTVALGIGYFTEGIFNYFHNFVVVNNPKDLPGALQNFYNGEPRHEGIREAVGKVVEKILFRGEELEKMDDAWKLTMRDVYKEQVEKIRKELRFATTSTRNACNTLAIDLCFVLDTTGSMTGYIEMAKKKVQQITENIKKNVNDNSGRTANLRVGFVAYKTRDNPGHLNHQQFTTNHTALQNFVDAQRSSGGRGNEDKEDGILKALSFDWKGLVKFMVLIGDVPDHGTVGTMNETMRKMARQNIYVLYVTINPHITNAERDRLRIVYQSTMNSKIKDKGFREIDMKQINGNTDALSDTIVDQVNYVIMSEFM